MSNYNGRRGPNVSHFLRDLNTINPQDSNDDVFNPSMEDDLALFTNTNFYDFDSGQNTDFQAQPVKVNVEQAQTTTPGDESALGDLSMDFISNDFNFEFNNTYNTPHMGPFPDATPNFASLNPAPTAAFDAQVPQQQPVHLSPAGVPEHPGVKRKADVQTDDQSESPEVPRVAAEEDKRRRNTAASARFRIKKKQREQALEKSAKEMTEKVNGLQSKVQQLETENKWLKNLLVEKNEGNENIAALWKEFTRDKVAALAADAQKER